MLILKNISPETVVSIDIETRRFENRFDELPEDLQEAWRYKLKQDGVVPSDEEVAKKWIEFATLYPEFSKVCAISFVYQANGKLRCKGIVGKDEEMILAEAAILFDQFYNSTKNYTLVAHAGKFFDYPYLCKRYILNRMPIPSILDESDKKPWDMRLLCTNDLWRSFGTGSGSSLQALCAAGGIESSKVDLVGDEVGRVFFEGTKEGLERIREYCNRDAVACYNVFLLFKGISPFKYADVVLSDDAPVENPGVLRKFFKSKKLSEAEKKKIKAEFEKLLPAEKTVARTILTTALWSLDKGRVDHAEVEFIETLF